MKRNALVARDVALAAYLGVLPQSGSDFGVEFGDDDYGDDYGEDDDIGDDYGADFGAAKRRQRRRPANRREMMLNPNKGSNLKVEEYVFSVNLVDTATGLSPVFGNDSPLTGSQTPDVWLRPCRATLNVQDTGLCYISEIKVGNVSGTVGGVLDGASFAANSVGTRLSLPLMSPSTKANVAGSWTTFVPPARVPGDSYLLVMSLIGPATMAPRG